MYLRKYKTITIQLDTLFNFKQTLLVKFLSIDRLFFLKSEQKFKPIFLFRSERSSIQIPTANTNGEFYTGYTFDLLHLFAI
jgi:hypothetical protein